MEANQAELEAATRKYVAAAEALYGAHAGDSGWPSADNDVVQILVDSDLLGDYRAAADHYALALEASGYGVPPGLLVETTASPERRFTG